MNKQEARRVAKNFRKSLNIKRISMEYIKEIVQEKYIESYQRIGLYYPLEYEIDLLKLVEIYPLKKFYFPCIEAKKLCFREGEAFREGKYHIMEPTGEQISIEDLEMIFIPALAINKDKKRLGYGKGYYDKALASFKGIKIGVCPKELQNLDIEMMDFDLSFDEIVGGES